MILSCFTDSEISMKLKGCSCGKNTTRTDKVSCSPSARRICPCLRKGMRCSRNCICKNCCNHDNTETDSNSSTTTHIRNLKCRCGERMAKKSSNHIACKDGKKEVQVPLSRLWTRLLLFLRVRRLPKCARCSFRLLDYPVRCKEEKITGYL